MSKLFASSIFLPVTIGFLLLASQAHAGTAINVRLDLVGPDTAPITTWTILKRYLGIRTYISKPQIGAKYTVTSTAYAPSPYQTDATPCITASGDRVRRGTVASNFLPLGTLLEIDGEPFIVEDRMNPRHQNSIDVYFPSTSEALAFGAQQLEITIVGSGEPGQALPASTANPTPVSADAKILILPIHQPTPVERVRNSWRLFTSTFLRTARPDVNRFDVDCTAESNQ